MPFHRWPRPAPFERTTRKWPVLFRSSVSCANRSVWPAAVSIRPPRKAGFALLRISGFEGFRRHRGRGLRRFP